MAFDWRRFASALATETGGAVGKYGETLSRGQLGIAEMQYKEQRELEKEKRDYLRDVKLLGVKSNLSGAESLKDIMLWMEKEKYKKEQKDFYYPKDLQMQLDVILKADPVIVPIEDKIAQSKEITKNYYTDPGRIAMGGLRKNQVLPEYHDLWFPKDTEQLKTGKDTSGFDVGALVTQPTLKKDKATGFEVPVIEKPITPTVPTYKEGRIGEKIRIKPNINKEANPEMVKELLFMLPKIEEAKKAEANDMPLTLKMESALNYYKTYKKYYESLEEND